MEFKEIVTTLRARQTITTGAFRDEIVQELIGIGFVPATGHQPDFLFPNWVSIEGRFRGLPCRVWFSSGLTYICSKVHDARNVYMKRFRKQTIDGLGKEMNKYLDAHPDWLSSSTVMGRRP